MTIDTALAWADREIAKKKDPRWCPMPDIDEVEVLAAEVRRLRSDNAFVEALRSDLTEERQEHQATLADAADLRQRHAEAVDLLETAVVLAEPCVMTHSTHDCTNCDWHQRADAWLASEARKGVARDE